LVDDHAVPFDRPSAAGLDLWIPRSSTRHNAGNASEPAGSELGLVAEYGISTSPVLGPPSDEHECSRPARPRGPSNREGDPARARAPFGTSDTAPNFRPRGRRISMCLPSNSSRTWAIIDPEPAGPRVAEHAQAVCPNDPVSGPTPHESRWSIGRSPRRVDALEAFHGPVRALAAKRRATLPPRLVACRTSRPAVRAERS